VENIVTKEVLRNCSFRLVRF